MDSLHITDHQKDHQSRIRQGRWIQPRTNHGFDANRVKQKTKTLTDPDPEETNQIARTRFFEGRVMLRTHPRGAHSITLAPTFPLLGHPQRLYKCPSLFSRPGPKLSQGSSHWLGQTLLIDQNSFQKVPPLFQDLPYKEGDSHNSPCDSGPVLGRTQTS